jgi:hypothetical protein
MLLPNRPGLRAYSLAPAPDRRGRVVDALMPPMIRPRVRSRPATEPQRTDQRHATDGAERSHAQRYGRENPQSPARERGVQRTEAATDGAASKAVQRNRPAKRARRAVEPSYGPRASTVGPSPEPGSVSRWEPVPSIAALYAAPAVSPVFQSRIDRATNPGQYCERCGKEMVIPEKIATRRINAKRFCSNTCRNAQWRIDKRLERAAKGNPSKRYFK